MATTATKPPSTGRFDMLVQEFTDQLKRAREDQRASHTQQTRHEAVERIDQFQQALAMVREAEGIEPGTTVQFGTPASNWQFRIPPRLDEYRAVHPAFRAEAHRVVTHDPLVIAYLRQMIRTGRVPDLVEVPVGHYWVPPRRAGADGRWVDARTYEAMVEVGSVVGAQG